MTTPIERGRVRVLFRTGSYDGMTSGVGVLDGTYVHLDATEQMGWYVLRPRWRELEDLLEELLGEDDADDIWDQIERKYDEKMHEDQPRRFKVRALTDEQFRVFAERHRQFQLHVGLHCDFLYDEHGRPRHYTLKNRDLYYWDNSTEYHKVHFFDAAPPPSDLDKDALPLLGHIDAEDLYAPSPFRGGDVSDPRSDELKAYQRAWKPGDPVRLDW